MENIKDRKGEIELQFKELFNKKPIIGMIHLLPLPGSPNYQGDIESIEKRALDDLKALTEGGVDAFIIENFGDVPYDNEISLEGYSVMLSIINKIQQHTSLPFGINIQFNSTEQEWAMAFATHAAFIRVESFVENRIGTHGISFTAAPKLMRQKKQYPSECMIFSDVHVKHSYPMTEISLEDAIHEAYSSGASAVIITGRATGKQPEIEDVRKIKELYPDIPVLIGSGINERNAAEYLSVSDGIIVGSSIKYGGDVNQSIDEIRVKHFMEAVRTEEKFS